MGGSMDKKLIKAYLPWGLCAGIFTIAAASGLFYEMDNRLSDALYQERRGTDGRIAIVGIDQRSLEALGPFGTWDRRILAQTVSYLNQGRGPFLSCIFHRDPLPSILSVYRAFSGKVF